MCTIRVDRLILYLIYIIYSLLKLASFFYFMLNFVGFIYFPYFFQNGCKNEDLELNEVIVVKMEQSMTQPQLGFNKSWEAMHQVSMEAAYQVSLAAHSLKEIKFMVASQSRKQRISETRGSCTKLYTTYAFIRGRIKIRRQTIVLLGGNPSLRKRSPCFFVPPSYSITLGSFYLFILVFIFIYLIKFMLELYFSIN